MSHKLGWLASTEKERDTPGEGFQERERETGQDWARALPIHWPGCVPFDVSIIRMRKEKIVGEIYRRTRFGLKE